MNSIHIYRKLLLFGMPIFVSFISFGQFKPIYTQYMLNQYVLNPGVAGMHDYWDIKASSRVQWVGVDGAPVNSYISFHGPINKQILNRSTEKGSVKLKTLNNSEDRFFHGIGGMIVADQTGPTSIISAYASYTANLMLTEKFRLGIGAAPGFQNFYINGSQLEISNARSLSVFVPDLTVGLWLYSDKFYFGLASHQVLESRLKVYDVYSSSNANRLYRHYFINTGYRIDIHEEFHFIPGLAFRYIQTLPADMDINLKAFYKSDFWAGVTYRPFSQSAAVIVGFLYDKKIEISYSYDYFNTYLNKVSFGTHELMLGYRIKAKTSHHSPSDFW